MPKQNALIHKFNRGIISPLAFARVDLERLAMACETMTNYIARVFGSMYLRQGWEYITSTRSDSKANYMEFVFSTDDAALVEVTDSYLRFIVSDAAVTRGSVSTAVTNGSFDTDVSSWTDGDESGATSAWVTGGYLGLTGNGTQYAIRTQQITVAGADQNDEHALRIVIQRGPVVLRVGSTSGGDEYITETTLGTGTHSLALTPTGNFYIQFKSNYLRQTLVDSCNVEGSGVMTLPAPWLEADLDDIRFDQSGDILYVACEGYQQRKIERRSTRSWSIVKYEPDDGPWRVLNVSPTTITPSALNGNVTLTASAPIFKSTNVGGLYRVASVGQHVTASVTGENQFTNAILVEGAGDARIFSVVRTGTWDATLTLQRSMTSSTGPWQDITTYTTNATVNYDDGLDNQIAWYRFGCKTGDYTSGTAAIELNYTVGSIYGIARITVFSSTTSVSAEVIEDFGGTDASSDWWEGEWSDRRGWPTSVALAEGRLIWAGKNGIWGSISDAFDSFDDNQTGDSGPIARTIGSGPVDTINWVLALQRVILGAEGTEYVCKSSSLDEPLTPTNFTLKAASTQGSANVEAVIVDKLGVYVQRGGTRVMQIATEQSDGEYGSADLTILCPEVTDARVKRMAVQRQPDTRIHCVLDDGTVALAIFDRAENVLCWSTITTDGVIEDVSILPGDDGVPEDKVYYTVKRTINGSTKRYLEKWALESECQGGTLSRNADCFIEISQASSATITGLSHLEAESVVVWANGKYLGSYTVASGSITVSEAVTTAIVGLTYTAQWKSTKLAYAAGLGTALLQNKRISQLGLILKNTHYQAIQYGRSFTDMEYMPATENGTSVAADTVHSDYDETSFAFPGGWDTDSRLCLQTVAPRPATIIAAVVSVETHDRY
jgi:hypothetical protein